MNLAVKYRPMSFAEVVGQEHIKKTLVNALKKGVSPHAFLFSGGRGTGKTTIARLLAKSLNCLDLQDGQLCGKCEMCLAANSGQLVDLIEIDAASHTGVDNVRDLIDKMQFQPTVAQRKIHIIDEVHMLSRGAFNALLKTLEEPPEHVYFILATTERHKIPDTIQSRCQSFNFRHLTKDEIAGRLQEICDREEITADRDGLLMLANEADGGLRDAIFLLEQHTGDGELSSKTLSAELGLAPHTALVSLYEYIQQKKLKEAVEFISEIASEGFSLSNFSKSFLSFLRDKMLEMVNSEQQNGLSQILEMIRIFSQAHIELKNSIIPTLPLEVAIVSAINGDELPKNEEKSSAWFPFAKKSESKKEPEQKIKTEARTEIKSESEEDVVFEAPEISLESVEKMWGQVLSKISTASVRMALKNCRVTKADSKFLELAFNSASFQSKVDAPQANQEVVKAFEEIFKTPIKVITKVEAIQLEPVEEVSKEEGLNGKDLEEAFQEVFGQTPNE